MAIRGAFAPGCASLNARSPSTAPRLARWYAQDSACRQPEAMITTNDGATPQGTIMEKVETLTILNALANGIHPATGQQFPADSPYQHPDTVRALFAAVRALEQPHTDTPPPAKPRSASAPANIGSRWTPEEEQRLAAAFDAGKRVSELATLHARSIAAIEARLLKLGKIDASAVTAPLRYGTHPAGNGTRQSG